MLSANVDDLLHCETCRCKHIYTIMQQSMMMSLLCCSFLKLEQEILSNNSYIMYMKQTCISDYLENTSGGVNKTNVAKNTTYSRDDDIQPHLCIEMNLAFAFLAFKVLEDAISSRTPEEQEYCRSERRIQVLN